MHARLIILGSGPAGYTAALYAARAGLAPLLITGAQPGGQLTTTTEVENYPGVQHATGPELVETMRLQAEAFGTQFKYGHVTKVDFQQRPLRLWVDDTEEVTCDALIIATGATAKYLGLPSEEVYKGFGISACATCDGFFFKNAPVAVIGGGNTAVEEALYLANLCSEVTLIVRKGHLKAEKILQERLFAHPKIKVLWNTEVVEFCGQSHHPRRLTHLQLATPNGPARLEVEGAFVAIGHAPQTDLFEGQLFRDDYGYLIPWHGTKTNVPGVFAAGDVADSRYRQAVTAAGMGCMAALDAEAFLAL